MAELVMGIGVSHSPALNMTADDYAEHIQRDKLDPRLTDKEGRVLSYDELLTQADPAIAGQLDRDVLEPRIAECERSLDRVAGDLAGAGLDALIVVGDDQGEQYFEDIMPAMLIFWGDTIENTVTDLPDDAPEYWRRARSMYHEADGPREYPVASDLALHLIHGLMDDGFDVSHSKKLRFERGEGHAFGFVHRRLMGDKIIPIVPFALNTYFAPNQPRPGRCYELGQALRQAVEGWDGAKRVGILGSGGLSHFMVDEDLDREVMAACRANDKDSLVSLPLNKLNFGNSEIRNWIAVAGAAEGLATQWQAYEPCYRTPAGTGCGMGFAVWS
jgi:3-O-methylgallate 3,4-dioxygenase